MISKVWLLNAILFCSTIYLLSGLTPMGVTGDISSDYSCQTTHGAELSLADCCYALYTQCNFESCEHAQTNSRIETFCEGVYS